MKFGKLQPQGKVEFDGYQELMNWTSAGSESSVSLSVDGDTDMEYVIECRNLNADYGIALRPNEETTNYGGQYLRNNSGTIAANRTTYQHFILCDQLSTSKCILSCIDGLVKMAITNHCVYTSGTTIANLYHWGQVYNSTDNITSLYFLIGSGNFTAGTNIRVLGRRVS